jgi:hypothetical protein
MIYFEPNKTFRSTNKLDDLFFFMMKKKEREWKKVLLSNK